jgi:short-subunit dehydrogenase involved in D-alanine esterification of teichoic acids
LCKTANKLSPAEKLLIQGKFADAKRAFAADGDSKMAQVCSDFIKSKRAIEQYKMGLEAAKRNKNRTTIANALRDLEKYQKLYKQYNVEYNELEIIINNYKSI